MSQKYDEYILQHKSSVKEAFNWLCKNTPELFLDEEQRARVEYQIVNAHDQSKYSKEEWDAYLNYFYPDENHPKDDNAFDLAWLHHLHNNPHHWQYWILQRDNGEQVPLDMPEKYVIEMLCDWMSFSKKNPESTAYKWYNDNKDKMILSENTIKLIEKYIDLLKEPLK